MHTDLSYTPPPPSPAPTRFKRTPTGWIARRTSPRAATSRAAQDAETEQLRSELEQAIADLNTRLDHDQYTLDACVVRIGSGYVIRVSAQEHAAWSRHHPIPRLAHL